MRATLWVRPELKPLWQVWLDRCHDLSISWSWSVTCRSPIDDCRVGSMCWCTFYDCRFRSPFATTPRIGRFAGIRYATTVIGVSTLFNCSSSSNSSNSTATIIINIIISIIMFPIKVNAYTVSPCNCNHRRKYTLLSWNPWRRGNSIFYR